MKVNNISTFSNQRNSSTSPQFGRLKFFSEGVRQTIFKHVAEQEDRAQMRKAINYVREELDNTKFADADVYCDLYNDNGSERLGFYIGKLKEGQTPIFYDWTEYRQVSKAALTIEKTLNKYLKEYIKSWRKLSKTVSNVELENLPLVVRDEALSDPKVVKAFEKMNPQQQ